LRIGNKGGPLRVTLAATPPRVSVKVGTSDRRCRHSRFLVLGLSALGDAMNFGTYKSTLYLDAAHLGGARSAGGTG